MVLYLIAMYTIARRSIHNFIRTWQQYLYVGLVQRYDYSSGILLTQYNRMITVVEEAPDSNPGTDHFCILYYTTIYNSFKSIIPSFLLIHTPLSYIQIHYIVSCYVVLRNVTDFAQHTKLQQFTRVFICTFLSGSVLYSLKYNNTIMKYNQNHSIKTKYIQI